jgi:hypothetical protein
MYKELFSTLTFGAAQSYGSLSALPLTAPMKPGALEYLTLSEALSLSLIRIEEVSEGGSVPELRVISAAKIPVLILAGEEVKGARQNRILNTSILIPATGELIIPVSCTERGRWSYNSPDFKDSGNISSKDIRYATTLSVLGNLAIGRGHRSDQGQVWDRIEELHEKSNTADTARTRAMDDAFKNKANDLEEALRHFRLNPGQTGILFFHGGKAAGMDLVSRPAAYARLHEKLVKSYVIDHLGDKAGVPSPERLMSEARRFLDDAMSGEAKPFPSPGLGDDLRLRAPRLHGSMLFYEKEALHVCCFRTKEEESRFATYSTRRSL